MKTTRDVRIVDTPIDAGKPAKPRYRTARDQSGHTVRIRMLDADSPSFTADFLSAFAANVRRARAENRALKADD